MGNRSGSTTVGWPAAPLSASHALPVDPCLIDSATLHLRPAARRSRANGWLARAAVLTLMVARCCTLLLAAAAPVLDPDMGVLEMLATAWSGVPGKDTWIRGSDCDSMKIVNCDVDGHVIAIDTFGSKIAASIPEGISDLKHLTNLALSYSGLTGSLPAALFALPSLKYLYLSYNELSGSIPATVGDAKVLLYLTLSYNQLSGSLPSSLGSLSSLTRLFMTHNAFSGSIPENLSNLLKLQVLGLDHNTFTGCIPASVSSLSRMRHLYLSENEFTGPIPSSLGTMMNLWTLYLRGNHLTGPIPASLGNCSNLDALDVGENDISGTIPATLGNLRNVMDLSLDSNQLTGTLPSSLANLCWLTYLTLDHNSLSGSIPASLGNITGIETLLLHYNQFTGQIPESLGDLSNLRVLSLKANFLTGSIPYTMGNFASMTSLDLSVNNIAGTIPATIGNLQALKYLYLDSNALSSNIPSSLGTLSELIHLRLNDNQLTGQIPESLGDLNSLQSLHLNSNRLSGTLPSSLGNLYNLIHLLLNDNQLTGQIPESLGNLWYLESLFLYSNQLSGTLPSSLSNHYWLVQLHISHNQFTGNVPASLGYLTDLQAVSANNNYLTGPLPTTLGKLASLTSLDLSMNIITGAIPTTFGNLQAMKYLDLRSNQLSGYLPSSLANLSALENLFLQYNQLTGQIPESLGNLTKLEVLSAKRNYFTGPLPPTMGKWSSMTLLDVGLNYFSGTIPATIGNLPAMKYLYMNSNQLSGSLPSSLGNLSALNHLYLNSNMLNGTLPSSLGNLSALNQLLLHYNQFTGQIPDSLGNLANLEAISARSNRLTGPLPPSLGTWSSVYYLDLSANSITGPIPDTIGNLQALKYLYFYANQLSGSLPSTLGNLSVLIHLLVNNNQLTGQMPQSLADLANLEALDVSVNNIVGTIPVNIANLKSLKYLNGGYNFLTAAAEDPPACPTYQLVLQFNCFPNNLTICSSQQTQKNATWCQSFCGNEPQNSPCSGHGVCSYQPPSTDAKCACDYGYTDGTANGTCVPQQGPYIPPHLSSYSHPMALFQSASSAPNGSIFLSSAPSTASWGAAFTQQPIALFLPTTRKAPCDQPIAFSVSFAFRMTPAAASAGSTAGEGLAFVVTSAAPQGAAASVGLGGVGRRSVGVEFDSVLSVKHSDPNDNHVGVNVGGSPVSLASATAPLILNDAQTKHAWIHYDPYAGGTLQVFLSASKQQPLKPLLTARVSLCGALKPTMGDASFLFGFVAATNSTQRHDILWWNIEAGKAATVNWQSQNPGSAFGRVASNEEVAASSEILPSSFHYASIAFHSNADGLPFWNPPSFASWMRPESSWPVKNQHGCADSSAYAVVAAVEAAYSIMGNLFQPPRLSVEALRMALSSNCDDMSPRDVLAFLAAATRKGGGLVDEAAAAGASQRSMASAGRRERLQKTKYYGIQGFEETPFGGWLGLLLAVQRQPVVVRIEASAPSFLNYDGTLKYADASCFQNGVNHAVLVVGFGVGGNMSSPFSLPVPLWVIRNSWGSEWGAAGHMFMDMQSGPGICGINTLPGIFPVVRAAADPCGSKSVKLAASAGVASSNALNPCGQFKCSKAGSSNRCACASTHFVEASHPDGSKTCAYVDACGLAGSNPCVVGTCVNDGRGSYSCVCPPGFIQGTTATGTLSCAPGDSKGSYTVLGSNVRCFHLLPVLGLTLDQLKQQNKKLPAPSPSQ
ncbi:hypothetical protein CLOP_g14328 [Closterium sp. NIES-67]|nr:hypothetical protein CLOP_g14328 [Closterium sp. NIES-67]